MLLAWGVSIVVMIAQKDLGSSLLFFALFMVMLWVATDAPVVPRRRRGAVRAPAPGSPSPDFGHVQERVDIWLDPWKDINGAGFQIAQAWFAMASGGLTGTGLGLGNPCGIPLVETDFIFAAIGEELGLLGATVIFALHAAGRLRPAHRGPRRPAVREAARRRAHHPARRAVVHHHGGVTRLLPLTGVTLPFVSYGGSSLVANYVLLALLLRISDENARRPRADAAPRREPTEVCA